MADATAAARPSAHSAGARSVRAGDVVFLVDGSSFVFRAYFQSMNQDRKYNYRADGLPTGAVRLFCNKLFQFIREGAVGIRPSHLAIIFDKSEDSFRREIYPAYKTNRSEPPEDLVPQFPLMRAAVSAFGLRPVEQIRYEADDLIATYARQATAAGADVLIISADKDLMQLVGPRVGMYDPASGENRAAGRGKAGVRPERRIGIEEVIDYFGVPPEKVVDVQALAGDSTDNVPGVPGIGVKTAAQLIAEYGDLETLLARAEEIRQPKRRENLVAFADQARLSRRLVALVDDVPLEVPLEDLSLAEPDPRALIAFLKAMDFSTLTRRASEIYGVDAAAIAPDPRYLRLGEGALEAPAEEAPGPVTARGEPAAEEKAGRARPDDGVGELTPAGLAAARRLEGMQTPVDRSGYEIVTTEDALARWVAAIREAGLVAIDTETTSLDPMRCDLVGISLAVAPGRACYVPVGHVGGEGLLTDAAPPVQLDRDVVLARLRDVLTDMAILKIGQNIKYDLLVLENCGIVVEPYDDTMLISYACDGGATSHGMDELSKRWLGHAPIAFKDVAGTGKAQVTFDRIPLDRAAEYAAEDADVTLRLWRVLRPRLPECGVTTVYETLERPLVPVLARMESRGVRVDRQVLSRMSGDFAQKLARIEDEIQELAGEPFNVGSPKQVGDILFGKMGLPGGRKTKTGAWSTSAQVLEDLAAEGVELCVKLLEWRQVSKLKSTYTDALPEFIHPRTGRVHTSFQMAATTTGRLSSSDPNLQNIPIRTEEGRKIRAAFVAEPGMKLLSADYSQIELRVLAHMANIPQLRQAFADGLDIHAMTASEMFGVPIEGMDPMIRRRAKAINFGIIYGISAYGLANQLGIGREEAGAYIRKYVERFPGIRDYMEETKRFAHRHGYVMTLFGRKAHYPEIGTSNPSMRAFFERAAINAPIQGSAADIIRRAMIRMEPALKAAGLAGAMLLQVHDELVFEVPEEEVEATIPVVAEVMRAAPLPAVDLAVPLEVEARAAASWADAH